MKVWIDLANSPHVPLFIPLVQRLEVRGHEVVLTVRDHAQTLELAKERWPEAMVIGGASPAGRAAKAAAIGRRVRALRRFAVRERPDVALSHGSYAQVVAARLARVPAVTMMDYEHQPANHLSFRLSATVVTPAAFPADDLKRFGARRVVTYDGFKEELYLAGFRPDEGVLEALGLDPSKVVAVFRPPPEGALYHRGGNERFDAVLAEAFAEPGVQVVLLPRTQDQRRRYEAAGAIVPSRAVDGASLLALADVVIGAGGTMSREAALLGTPTHTVFAGRLAAVDAELIKRDLLQDLRAGDDGPAWVKRPAVTIGVGAERADVVAEAVELALAGLVSGSMPRVSPSAVEVAGS